MDKHRERADANDVARDGQFSQCRTFPRGESKYAYVLVIERVAIKFDRLETDGHSHQFTQCSNDLGRHGAGKQQAAHVLHCVACVAPKCPRDRNQCRDDSTCAAGVE